MTALDGLPIEVLRSIVDQLHPTADSTTLLSLLRVSNALWDCAARRLYADLTLTKRQVVMLIVSPDRKPTTANSDRPEPVPMQLSRRTRKALSFVHRLTILGPWPQPILDMLWDVTLAQQPLFPNVVQVLFDFGPPFQRLPLPRPPLETREPGIFVFNSVDACVLGNDNMLSLFQLPARSYRSITCHEVDTSDVLQDILGNEEYLQCDQWRCFQSDTQGALQNAACCLESEFGQSFPAKWEPRVPPHPVQLYLREGATLGQKMVEYYDAHQNGWIKVFADTHDILQIHHFPRGGAGAPSCFICGTYLCCPSRRKTARGRANHCLGKTWRAGELQRINVWIQPTFRDDWRRDIGDLGVKVLSPVLSRDGDHPTPRPHDQNRYERGH